MANVIMMVDMEDGRMLFAIQILIEGIKMEEKVKLLYNSVVDFIKDTVDREEHINELGIIHIDFLNNGYF